VASGSPSLDLPNRRRQLLRPQIEELREDGGGLSLERLWVSLPNGGSPSEINAKIKETLTKKPFNANLTQWLRPGSQV
jgi:hypothetical protein